MDCKKHSSSNRAFIKVNEGSMYRDMGLSSALKYAYDNQTGNCKASMIQQHILLLCSVLLKLTLVFFLRFVEADIGFLAGMPAIIRLEISITRAKQACEFPAAHTVSECILCSCFPLWGPFENAR